MAVIACPSCATKLRIADNSTATVRCPKCKTAFSPPRSAPAFEVVDEPTPAKPVAPTPPAPPPPAKATGNAFNFDAAVGGGTSKSKPQRAAARQDDADDFDFEDEEEEETRPRRKRRRDDDDEEDRPRSRRRSRDEDDDDDRPRSKKRKYGRSREEEDWAESGKKRVSGAGPAKIGMLMLVISLGLYLGTFLLLTFYALLAWIGVYLPSGLMIVPGLLGIANWVTGAVGFGFSIAGPARSRGLAIAAASVAAVHLILAFVIANNTDSGMFSSAIRIQAIGLTGKFERMERLAEDASKNPSESKTKALQEAAKEADEFRKDNKEELFEIGYYLAKLEIKGSKSSEDSKAFDRLSDEKAPSAMRWADLSTQLPFFAQFLDVISYHNKAFSDYILSFLSGATEVALLILTVLLIGSIARAMKDEDAVGKAKIGLLGVCIAAGLALLLTVLCGVVADSAQSDQKKAYESLTSGGAAQDFESATKRMKEASDKARSARRMEKSAMAANQVFIYMLFSGMMVMPAFAALQTLSAAGRRAR